MFSILSAATAGSLTLQNVIFYTVIIIGVVLLFKLTRRLARILSSLAFILAIVVKVFGISWLTALIK